jgi:hypothetical protein
MAAHHGRDGFDVCAAYDGFERQPAVANATAAGCLLCVGLPAHPTRVGRRRTDSPQGDGVWHFGAADWFAGCL